MRINKRTRERLLTHCENIHDDDCLDPQEYFRFNSLPGGHKRSRKAMQLCRQVGETLDLVISGECRDSLLQSLHVVSVQPAPDTSRLLVFLESDLRSEELDRELILGLLAEQSGRLRCEVARAIHRKKTPSLVFELY